MGVVEREGKAIGFRMARAGFGSIEFGVLDGKSPHAALVGHIIDGGSNVPTLVAIDHFRIAKDGPYVIIVGLSTQRNEAKERQENKCKPLH